MNKPLNFHRLIPALLCVLLLGFAAMSCSSSKGNTRKKPAYSKGRTSQAKWNTTTSTHRTYYIKKRKPHKRYKSKPHH